MSNWPRARATSARCPRPGTCAGRTASQFDEYRLCAVQVAAAHRAHAPLEQQLAHGSGDTLLSASSAAAYVFVGGVPLTHFRQQRSEPAKGLNSGIALRQLATQIQRVCISSDRLQERGPFEIDLVLWIAGRERLIENGARLFEAMETARQLRADVERAAAGGRHRNRLGANQFRPVHGP